MESSRRKVRSKCVHNRNTLFASAVDCQVDQTVGVTPFVVVPRDNLVEVIIEEDACISIDGGGMLVMDEIAGDDMFVGVSKDTLHGAIGGFLQGSLDFVASGGLFRTECQVDNGDISSRNLKECTVTK